MQFLTCSYFYYVFFSAQPIVPEDHLEALLLSASVGDGETVDSILSEFPGTIDKADKEIRTKTFIII